MAMDDFFQFSYPPLIFRKDGREGFPYLLCIPKMGSPYQLAHGSQCALVRLWSLLVMMQVKASAISNLVVFCAGFCGLAGYVGQVHRHFRVSSFPAIPEKIPEKRADLVKSCRTLSADKHA